MQDACFAQVGHNVPCAHEQLTGFPYVHGRESVNTKPKYYDDGSTHTRQRTKVKLALAFDEDLPGLRIGVPRERRVVPLNVGQRFLEGFLRGRYDDE